MIKGFIHVAIMNKKSKEILDEILTTIYESRLLDITDELHIGVIGGKVNINSDKVFVHDFGGDFKQYEYPTLKLLQQECKKNKDMLVYYLHTKGSSTPFRDGSMRWRRDMLNCIVKRHKECIKGLEEYDTVGTKLLILDNFPRHYSGNFWRAKASYINKLPSFEGKTYDRFYAEIRLLINKDVLYLNIE